MRATAALGVRFHQAGAHVRYRRGNNTVQYKRRGAVYRRLLCLYLSHALANTPVQLMRSYSSRALQRQPRTGAIKHITRASLTTPVMAAFAARDGLLKIVNRCD
ncbi:hypothetical protein MRX96_011186 [Rhipicephalus microplus]